MKTTLLLALVVVAVASGCGKPEGTKPAATNETKVGENPIMAPVDYLGTIAKAQQSAVKTVDITSINKALEMFNVEEARFPKDLNELVEKKYLPQLPVPPANTKFSYDATTGTVKIVAK